MSSIRSFLEECYSTFLADLQKIQPGLSLFANPVPLEDLLVLWPYAMAGPRDKIPNKVRELIEDQDELVLDEAKRAEFVARCIEFAEAFHDLLGVL
jgi:hypothetical protein